MTEPTESSGGFLTSNGVLVVAALVALAIGFSVGGRFSDGASDSAGSAVQGRLGAAEMEAQVNDALRAGDSLDRTLALSRLMDGLDKTNVSGAAKTFAELIVAAHNCDIRALLDKWTAFDPDAAQQYVSEWSIASKRSLGVYETAMASTYNGGALETISYVRTLPSNVLKDIATQGLIEGWVRRDDIEEATAYLQTLDDGDLRDLYLNIFTAGVFFRRGLDGMIEWTDDLDADGHDGFKKTAFAASLTNAAYQDPERAARWHAEHAGRDYAEDTLWRISTGWVRKNPRAAISWVRSLPPSVERYSALRRALVHWNADQPEIMKAWLRRAELEDAEWEHLGSQFEPERRAGQAARKAVAK